ncbi:MAG: DUF2127 domain-containing protein [Acidobacteriota bacterium]
MPKTSKDSAHKTLDRFFYVSIWLKGLHAAFEIVGGIALFFTSPEFILRVVALMTQDELANDPNDFVASTLLHAAENISVAGERFAAAYLLSHGVMKIVLVMGLLRNRRWAYPAALAVFGGFILYQIYRFSFTHSLGLVALTVFDLAVMWLIWREYRLRYLTARP